jgi:hypothetical protein
LNISWNVADFVNVLMFRRKKVTHKPSRACAQQLTEVSSQTDEWYRSAYGTNIHTNIHFYIYIDLLFIYTFFGVGLESPFCQL